MKKRWIVIEKIKKYTKNISAFSAGMFVGVVYGSVVGTFVAAAMLGTP